MKLYLFVVLIAFLKINEAKFTSNKSVKSRPLQNAIIAIEIIDPHENKTDTKNSKRTIESSLGYGYQGNFIGKHSSPKYEVYKYSQHNIPPYTPTQYTQQASSYQIPNGVSKPGHNAGISNFYQPGTILFSTINEKGQLGQLSSQFPGSIENQHYPIPVIILRVHPDQLANPLYAKLPQNHLHASTINSIDINSLLSNHIANTVKQQSPVQPSVQQHQSIYEQQSPVQQQQPIYQQQYQQDYQDTQSYQNSQAYHGSQSYVQPQSETAQYQSSEYQAPDYQSSDYQSQQYYPQYEESQDIGQNYETSGKIPKIPNPHAAENYQHSSYQLSSPVYQQEANPVESYKPTELLTDENYPSDKHTQIIFKRSKGKSSNRNKQTGSNTQVQSSKPYISTQQSQPQKLKQPSPNYYQQSSNYYTIQYSDDQGYTHQKAPSYRGKEQEEDPYDTQRSQNQNYVYVSTDGAYDPHV